ncbi:ribosomal protein S3 [Iris pallida]|uniref:Ribosomal protein S3 (Plastid) n=1 Tax=Iris pallida TaxID=29817 RepID=A0AAX6GVB1_IRIPA|nr:ribosomal protein S3 [Iris pallida]
MIPICMVYESPHKRQWDKALILRKIILKHLGLIQTE